jgi:hypothetical protein
MVPMRVVKTVLVSVFGLAVVAALPAFGEDLTIVSTVKGGKDRTLTSTQYLSMDKARTSNGDSDTIVNYSTGAMIMIDNRKREYWETSAAEMAAMFEQLQQAGGGALGGLLGGNVTDVAVQKVDGSKKVAGYDCVHYLLSMGDDMRFDIWAAPDLAAPLQYYDASKAPYAAMGPMGRRYQKMFDEMKKIKGFPLSMGISAKMMMVKIDTLSEATEVKKDPIPASVFETPVGYKKKDAPFKKR